MHRYVFTASRRRFFAPPPGQLYFCRTPALFCSRQPGSCPVLQGLVEIADTAPSRVRQLHPLVSRSQESLFEGRRKARHTVGRVPQTRRRPFYGLTVSPGRQTSAAHWLTTPLYTGAVGTTGYPRSSPSRRIGLRTSRQPGPRSSRPRPNHGSPKPGLSMGFLQLSKYLENLRLNRDIQSGRRLVGNDQSRFTEERHRNHHPLA